MIVKNITRNTTISKDLKTASSFLDRLFGLLLKRNPRSLLFKTKFGIHTFFLSQSIDVLVLNDENAVIRGKTIKPNQIFIYNPRYDTVIELPKGSLRKSKTKIGDKLILI